MKKYYQSDNRVSKLIKTTRFILPLFLLMLVANNTVFAQTVNVSTTTDEVNGNTANIAALIASPGGTGISLREAVIATNNEPAGSTVTINIPSGNYALTIAGSDNTAEAGDLDVNTTVAAGNKTVNIVGAGRALTTITGLAGERIFDVHAINNTGSITFSLSTIKLTGGSPSSGSGGAMLTGRPGDVTNVTNCFFTGNTATSNGGAISQSSGAAAHDLNVTTCTFTNNTATGAFGGAINYSGIGNVTITGCAFANNTSGTQGGAINISGTGSGAATCNITKNIFTGNTANGSTFGGAVVGMVNVQAININYNRIVGNNGANVSTGKLITTGGGTVGSMDLTNNWWSVNTGPNGSTDILGSLPASWLQLKATATPGQICRNTTSTITADFLTNNQSVAITATNLSALSGTAVSFTNPVLGSLSNAQTTIQPGGTATATYTSGNTPGAGSVHVAVDNEGTTQASITVKQAATSETTVSVCNSFFWNDSTYKISGDYTYTTTSSQGCDSIATLHLTILSVTSTYTKTDASCTGVNNGSITINPTYGVSPFTYRIGTVSSYVNSNTFTGLRPGNYRVSILDANGCAGISDQVTIALSSIVGINITKTDATCFGKGDASITANGTGGTTPYQYRFGTAGTFGATNSWSGLNSGTYTVRMQDANGCTANRSIIISQPPALTIAITKTDESCPNARNGSIIANGVGGNSPYTYRFGTVGGYSSNNTFNNLRAASYRVFINDANGCGGNSVAVVIAQLSSTCFTANATARTVANKVESTNTSLNISLSPNPSRSNFSLLIRSSKQDAVTIRVMDVNGKTVYTAKGMPEQTTRFGEALTSGIYLVEIKQGDEVKTIKAVKIR